MLPHIMTNDMHYEQARANLYANVLHLVRRHQTLGLPHARGQLAFAAIVRHVRQVPTFPQLSAMIRGRICMRGSAPEHPFRIVPSIRSVFSQSVTTERFEDLQHTRGPTRRPHRIGRLESGPHNRVSVCWLWQSNLPARELSRVSRSLSGRDVAVSVSPPECMRL